MKVLAWILIIAMFAWLISSSNKERKEREKLNGMAECPYCHSRKTEKVTTGQKILSTSTLGLGSKKAGNVNWHCKNCDSYF